MLLFFITVLNKIEIHSENLRLMSVLCIKYLIKKMYQISYTKYVSNILQKKCIKCVRKEIRITLN